MLGTGLFIYLISTNQVISIGEGRLTELLRDIEVYNFKIWVLMAICLYIIFTLAVIVVLFLLNISNQKLDDLKLAVKNLLQGKFIPVTVEIDENIPVVMDKVVEAPFELSTRMNFNEEVTVKTVIPINMDIPMDTVIETSVMGIGKIKIPIKAIMPIKMDFKFEGPVKMNVQDFHLNIQEKAKVSLPPLEVPIKCTVKAKLNLDSNLAQFLK